jgi:hypothetical protein
MKLYTRGHVLVVWILGAATFACSLGSTPQAAATTAPASGQAVTPAVNSPAGDSRQIIIDAFTKLDSSYPYRLTETATGSICAQQLRTVEFASRGEWHAKWSGCMTGESIATGGKTYYLVNGSWTDTGAAPPGAEEQVNVTELVKASLANVRAAGSESLNGVNCKVYTFDLNDPSMKITGGKVWIRAADGLPHQVQAPFTISGFNFNVQLVYEYGVQVKIQAPIP